MIKLFNANETSFISDGVEVLDDIAISSYTSWADSPSWVNESKFKIDNDKSNSLKEGMILQLNTEKGKQLFRILKITKKNNKYIIATGRHIGFEFENNFIQDINIVEKSGRAAIKQIQGGTVYNCKYNLSSDIDTVASSRMVRKNGITALVGSDDNCFVNRWGGFLVLDNFNISMNEEIGNDRGVEVLIGKNLTDMEGSIDISSVVTGINPITYDGLTLPEGIYYSPLVNNYPEPRIQEFKFDDIKYKYSENNYDEEGYETLEEVYEAIRKACDNLYEVSNIDKPICNLRLKVADLTKTDQYKGDELNERIFQGDILTANLEEYGFNVKLKMTANKYNNVKDCYEDFDLGDAKENVFSNIDKVQTTIDKVVEQLGGNSWKDILDKSMQEAADLIAAGITDSYVVARKNEILVMDSEKVESAIQVMRINKNGIAFSKNGYNGPFTSAWTIDGKFNASFIATGELNAALIKTGFLMSANGKTWINMEDGTFSFNNGAFALDENNDIVLNGSVKTQKGDQFASLDSGGISFQDWHRKEQMLRMAIAYFSSNRDMNGIQFAMPKYSDFIRFAHVDKDDLTNGWAPTDTQYKFLDFWSGDFTIDNYLYRKGINVYSPIYMRGNNSLQFVNSTGYTSEVKEIGWNGLANLLGVCGDNGVFLGYKNGDSYQARIVATEESHPGTGDQMKSWGNWNFSGYTFHNAGINAQWLEVSGSKNCLQETKTYGERLINAYETAEYYFGDIGSGTINNEGECLVHIDDIFQECVNTNIEYHVFTQVYNGSIESIEKYQTYFIVKGKEGTKFSWELKAKRKGYENNRLDTKDDLTIGESGLELFGDEDFKSNTSEEILNEVLEFNLENVLLGGTNK